ncbi:MAG: hypothetical protein WD046_09255 [Paracoccaceae bacterium]
MKLALPLILLASSALAGDWSDLAALQDRVVAAPLVSEGEWRNMVEGRTVTYTIENEFFAREFYVTGTNRVVIAVNNGICLNGEWFMDGPAFCFVWEGAPPSCFTHHRLDGGVYINGVDDDDIEIQFVADVRRAVVQCGSELLSSLPQPLAEPVLPGAL